MSAQIENVGVFRLRRWWWGGCGEEGGRVQTTGGQNVRKEGGRAGCLSTLLPGFHAMPHWAKRHSVK